MKRLISIILVLMIVALSGCIDQDVSSETEGQTFERANLNLDGKMMYIELSPNDARAGENITAKLVVGNTGTENIISETIEIKAKAKSLDDFLANLALKVMSEEKKTMTFTTEYNEEIKPGMIKPLTRVFSTPREMKNRSLAGTYDITVILSVNGQKVESKQIKLKLGSGKPRENINTLEPAFAPTVTATPTSAVTVTVAPTITPTPTPTPVPTPETVKVDTFLFSWDDVPGNDNVKLIGFLKKRFGIDWVETANIEKTDNDMAINLTSGNNFITLTLNDEKTKLSLIIDDGRTDEFIGMNEYGKLNIYSGKIHFTRIKGWTFGEPSLTLDAGDWIQWQNLWDDEDIYTLVEKNGKFSNISVRTRLFFIFNTTGTYTFQLFYPKMRVAPPEQVITVSLNQSQ